MRNQDADVRDNRKETCEKAISWMGLRGCHFEAMSVYDCMSSQHVCCAMIPLLSPRRDVPNSREKASVESGKTVAMRRKAQGNFHTDCE